MKKQSPPPKFRPRTASVAPPVQSGEQLNVAAAIASTTDGASKVAGSMRVVEGHIAKLEAALSSEQAAHKDNLATLTDQYETAAEKLISDHAREAETLTAKLASAEAEVKRLSNRVMEEEARRRRAQSELEGGIAIAKAGGY